MSTFSLFGSCTGFVDESVVFRYFGACGLGFKPLEKLLFYEMDFEIYVFNNWLRNMVIEVFLKFRLELRNKRFSM